MEKALNLQGNQHEEITKNTKENRSKRKTKKCNVFPYGKDNLNEWNTTNKKHRYKEKELADKEKTGTYYK